MSFIARRIGVLAAAAALLVAGLDLAWTGSGQDTPGERKDSVSYMRTSPADDSHNLGRFAEFPASADEQRNQFVSVGAASPQEALEKAQSDLEQALATF
jgi:hypothetical protein